MSQHLPSTMWVQATAKVRRRRKTSSSQIRCFVHLVVFDKWMNTQCFYYTKQTREKFGNAAEYPTNGQLWVMDRFSFMRPDIQRAGLMASKNQHG